MAHRSASDGVSISAFLCEQWLPAIEATLRPSTFAGDRGHVVKHLVPAFGELALAELGPQRINAFYAELSRPSGGGLAPTSVRRVHATLHRALRDAVRWGLLADNPANRSDPPKPRPPELAAWGPRELRAFLEAIEGDELFPLFFLLAMTGLRRGEALGLRWDDVDLAGRRLAIRQTVVEVGSRIIVSSPKTARGRRVVALDAGTAAVLVGLERAGDLVFSDGEPLRPTAVSKRFTALVKKSGLPRIRLHDLRHTHATLALQAGVHPKVVSERLGHSTVAFTLDIYSHVLGHMQSEAATQVASIVLGDEHRGS